MKRDGNPNPLVALAVVAWAVLFCLLPVAGIVAIVRWLAGA